MAPNTPKPPPNSHCLSQLARPLINLKLPPLKNRRCAQAHRSQYDFIDGFAKHMRDALYTLAVCESNAVRAVVADANQIVHSYQCHYDRLRDAFLRTRVL